MKEPKPKTCKVCKVVFKPSNSLQSVCGYKCASEYAKGQRIKAIARENKYKLNQLKTKGELLKELQIIFNRYIRLRDNGKPCISCGCDIKGISHASHFLSVGSHPSLRFNEFNVHSSCEKCNLYLHGNQFEYSIRLPERIGQSEFNNLISLKGNILKLDKYEIEELKIIYKNKIKGIEI